MNAGVLVALLSGTLALTSPAAVDSTPASGARLRFRAQSFADSHDIPNAVAFAIDERGVVFTANSFRYDGHGIFDVRRYPAIRQDDLTSHSVEDRRQLMRAWLAKGAFNRAGEPPATEAWLSQFSEQVRRVEDRDGDGRADHADVIADGMNDLVSGAAAGVLPWDHRIYATVIPDLLMLPDSAGTGERRRVLQTGFGVHNGQAGHDMHGLTIGNDGRLYWSIADRGYQFTTREGRTFSGHSGGVFRCWPDGSELERFATGLRNPQELAFTDAGDLFTGDNNADLGDASRLLYLPVGSDAGWQFFLQSMRDCGPWTEDHLWEMRTSNTTAEQPAWVNTPVAYAGSCPAGFAAYPGTGLPPREAGTLWLADFVGGVDAFKLEPQGAGFVRTDLHEGFRESWGICDFDFGYDGRAWALYWGESWDRNPRGRLIALTPLVAGVDTAAVLEVRDLFAHGFTGLDDERLARLLAHVDRRVRQRASFELARRERIPVLATAASRASSPLARMHALWGLGIVAHTRGAEAVRSPLTAALSDRDADVRRVAAIMLGEARATAATKALRSALRDASPRVRFAAAQALGDLHDTEATGLLMNALAANADSDAVLRQAIARALGRIAEPTELAAWHTHPDRAVRRGAVLALREAERPELSAFLADPDEAVATEAARAIVDRSVGPAYAALAATLPGLPAAHRRDAWLRRALHAALRSGDSASAQAVAGFAADSTTSDEWRAEALGVLAQWDRPYERDGVWGRWEPAPARAPGAAKAAIASQLPAILLRARGPALVLALELADREQVRVDNRALAAWVADERQDDRARIAALRWLFGRRAPEAMATLERALDARSDSLVAAALDVHARLDPAGAVVRAERIASDPARPLAVRQIAVRWLGTSAAPEAAAALRQHLQRVRRGAIAPELELDAIDAALASPATDVRAQARVLAEPVPGTTPRGLLAGGDAMRGAQVFHKHPVAQCVRCHTIDGAGGTTGPDLSLLPAHDRRSLRQALLDPSATLARGYETISLQLQGGGALTGVVRRETADSLMIATDDTVRAIAKRRLLGRSSASSAMPAMDGILDHREMRDVIEYLASRRDTVPDLALDVAQPLRIEPARATATPGREAGGGPLRLARGDHARGLGVLAPAAVSYAIPSGARVFVAHVGVDDGAAGTAGFEVRVDGRRMWTAGPMRRGRVARVWITLPPGARELELRADDGNNGPLDDRVDWVDPGFLR